MTRMDWLRTRRGDALALGITYATILQACLGLFITTTLSGQTTGDERLLEYRQMSLETRIAQIEQMGIPARLAVLERSADEVEKVKWMMYGLFATTLGGLVGQAMMIKGQRRMRRDGDE